MSSVFIFVVIIYHHLHHHPYLLLNLLIYHVLHVKDVGRSVGSEQHQTRSSATNQTSGKGGATAGGESQIYENDEQK